MNVSTPNRTLLLLTLMSALATGNPLSAQTSYQFFTLPLPESSASTAYHISNDGQIAGRIDGLDGVGRGYIYDPNGSLDLFDGADDASPFTELWGVNTAGQSAGYVSSADFSQFDAFRRETDGTLVPVNFLATPGPSNFGVDINEAGDVLVQGDGLTFVHSVGGTQSTLNVTGYSTNAGWGMNDQGIVAGVAWPGFFDTPNGVLYDLNDDSFEIWNYPNAAETSLHDINNDGVIVGTTTVQFGDAEQSFIRYASGELQFIEFAGASSTRLWGINDNGVLTGRYLDANQVSFAFYAVPVPEPSSALLVVFVSVVAASIRHRSIEE